jgi:hypothetical protein
MTSGSLSSPSANDFLSVMIITSATCFDFFGSRSHVVGMVIIKNKHDDGSGTEFAIVVTFDEREWPVL